jgi:hypothetical protein
MSVQSVIFKNKMAITIGKRSKAILDESVKQYAKRLRDIVSKVKPYIVTAFLSEPYTKARNTSEMPRRKTGALISSLSYTVRKTTDQSMSEVRMDKRHVQFTVQQKWNDKLTKMKEPINGISSYGELLHTSKRYKQKGYRTKLRDRAMMFIDRELRR